MKTLGFAIALSLTGAAAQAGTLFEIPINGGIARFQLDDDCQQSVCASISWTENDRHRNRHNGKETSQPESAKPSTRADSRPVAKLPPSDLAPALESSAEPSDGSVETPARTAAPASEGPAGSGSNIEWPATAVGAPVAPAEPAQKPTALARLAPPQPARPAPKATAASPVGEWLVEGGEARIRIEECAKNLCGVVSAANNANETDRKNPKPELRNRPIIGLPVLLDMKPAAGNRWEGRIYNAKNGQTYEANVSLLDPQRLRVEGCVFGGFICGGQNWTRVN